MRRIGVLMGYAQSDPSARSLVAAFLHSLEESGWTNGRNVSIEYRWPGGDVDRIRNFAKELVETRPDVIVANTTPVAVAVHQATRTIPIVFVIVSDPIGAGLVPQLSQPGGNITGFINVEASMGGKWLEILKEVAPRVRRAAIMFNPNTAPGGGSYFSGRLRLPLDLWGLNRSLPPFTAKRILNGLSQHWAATQTGALLSRRMVPCWSIARQSFRWRPGAMCQLSSSRLFFLRMAG